MHFKAAPIHLRCGETGRICTANKRQSLSLGCRTLKTMKFIRVPLEHRCKRCQEILMAVTDIEE